MKNIFYFLLSAAIALASSCNKDNSGPITICGEPRTGCADCEWNVFRCKVNGEDWCANCEDDPLFGCDPVDCQFYPNTGGLSIAGDGKQISNLNSTIGSHILEYRRSVYYDSNNTGNCVYLDIDSTHFNWLEVIDIDTIKKLIEGKFEYRATNECQDTIKITDGYFKLTYRP